VFVAVDDDDDGVVAEIVVAEVVAVVVVVVVLVVVDVPSDLPFVENLVLAMMLIWVALFDLNLHAHCWIQLHSGLDALMLTVTTIAMVKVKWTMTQQDPLLDRGCQTLLIQIVIQEIGAAL
jgi:hypothetical protein